MIKLNKKIIGVYKYLEVLCTNICYEMLVCKFSVPNPLYAAITEIIAIVVPFLIGNRLTPVHIIIRNVFSMFYGTLTTANVDYLVATSVPTVFK